MYQKFLLLNKMLLKLILKPKTCWKCWYVIYFLYFEYFLSWYLYFFFFFRISKTFLDYNLFLVLEPSTPRGIKICNINIITSCVSVKQFFSKNVFFLFNIWLFYTHIELILPLQFFFIIHMNILKGKRGYCLGQQIWNFFFSNIFNVLGS